MGNIGAIENVRGLLFDLDNTLVDRDRAFYAWAQWFVRERLALSDDEVDAAIAEMVALDAGGHGAKMQMFLALKEHYPQLTDSPDSLMAAMREGVLAHLSPLSSDAATLLAALDAAAMPWGIVSNGSKSQLKKIRKLGLETRAGCIVISEVAGMRKPEREIFEYAALQLELGPAELLFVGDHPDADVVGAANAGMRTAWICRDTEWPTRLASIPPDFIIDSLAELTWATLRPNA